MKINLWVELFVTRCCNYSEGVHDGSDPRVSTSSPLCVSPDDSEQLETSNWSHTWPTAVWQCFVKGKKIFIAVEIFYSLM